MKKLLGISLVAMMAVTSARADIASKAYVDSGAGTYVKADKTAGQNIKALDDVLGAGFSSESTVAQQIAAAITGADDALDDYYTKDEADAAFDAKDAAANVKTAVDAYTVNSKAISTNPVLSGADVAATGYTKANAASAIAATDTVNAALGKLEYKADANADAIAAEKTRAEGAEKDISDLVGTIPAGAQATTVTGYVDEKVAAAGADTTALANRVTTAEGNIADLQSDKQDKSKSTVASAGNYIAAGDGVAANLGALDTQLKTTTDAVATEKTRAETAEGAINTKIGTVPENSTVMAEIAKAQTAATYDDTALAGRVTTAESDIDALETGKADKATTLAGYSIADAYTKTETDTALGLKEDKANKVTAVSSTSTDTEYPSAKAVYTAVEGAKTASTDAISALDMVAADTTGTGNVVTSVNQVDGKVTAAKEMTAIPQPTATNETGVLVLTATSNGNGGYTYQWEEIARAGE